jgi:hypothetical protein
VKIKAGEITVCGGYQCLLILFEETEEFMGDIETRGQGVVSVSVEDFL